MSREKLHRDNDVGDASITIGERIKIIRKTKKLTQQAFAKTLGITQGFLCEIENGTKIASDTLLMALFYRHEINEKWFITGEGEMYIQKENVVENKAPVAYNGAALSIQDRIILKLFRALPAEEKMEVIGLLRVYLSNIGISDAEDALNEFKEEVKQELKGGGQVG